MAERLPRYRPLGVRIPGVPSVNYAQTGRAKAQVFDVVAKGLDQMATFAFEQQKREVVRDAEKYAFDNPLTDEQIDAAIKKGGITEDDINVDRDTVFGATVLATTGKVLSAQLNGEYRKAVGAWQKVIEGPSWNPNDPNTGIAAIQAELRGLEDGYSSLIADIDVGEATGFKASVATLGGAVYKTALEVANKKAVLANRMRVEAEVDEFPTNVRSVISAHAGDTATLNSQLNILKNDLRSSLYATGDAGFAESEFGKIDDTIDKASIDVLTAHGISDDFAANPALRASKLRRNEWGRYQAVWNSLSEKQKAEVRSAIRTEESARNTENERSKKANDDIQATTVGRIGYELSDDDITPERRDELITQLYGIAQDTAGRVISITTIRGMEKDMDEGVTSNHGGNLLLRQGIQDGTVTVENFDEKLVEFGVAYKDAVTMFDKLISTTRQADADVLRAAKTSAGVFSEVADVDDEQAQQIDGFIRRVDQGYIAAVAAWERGGMEGPKPRKIDIANQVQDEIIASGFTRDITDQINNANNQLQSYTSFRIVESTTDQEIDDLQLEGLKPKDADRVKNGIKAALRQIREARQARARYMR